MLGYSLGSVGLMLFAGLDESLLVDTFLLSCRALGRGVEYQMLVRLGQIAGERQLPYVILPYRGTARNQPAFEFLLAVGHPYRTTEENRIIFKLPAAIAATVRFDVETHQKSVLPGRHAIERGPDPPTGLLQAALLTRIATELATPAQVLRQIRPDIPLAQFEAVVGSIPTLATNSDQLRKVAFLGVDARHPVLLR